MANSGCPKEILLNCPFTWKPEKIVNFLLISHSLLEDNADLRAHIDSCLSDSKFGWAINLGKKHLQILTARKNDNKVYKKGKIPNLSSLCALVRLIRNNYVHQKNLKDGDKEELGWFEGTANGHQFRTHRFVQYWIDRFPMFPTFLWFQMILLRNELSIFYPSFLKTARFHHGRFRINDLIATWKAQLADATVIARYRSSNHKQSFIVEFREIVDDFMTGLLFGSLAVKISGFEEGNLIVNWYENAGPMDWEPVDNTYNQSLSYALVDPLTLKGVLEERIFIYAKGFRDVDENFKEILHESFNVCGNRCCRLVIFKTIGHQKLETEKQFIKSIVAKIAAGTGFNLAKVSLRDLEMCGTVHEANNRQCKK